jgi:hypothetical protein
MLVREVSLPEKVVTKMSEAMIGALPFSNP